MSAVGIRTIPSELALRQARLPIRTKAESDAREQLWRRGLADMIELLLASCTPEMMAFLNEFIFKTPERIEIIRKLKQGTKEWAQARVGLLTMSNSGKNLGHNKYERDRTKWVQSAVFDDFEGNEYTRWGTEHEPVARDQYVSQQRPVVAALVRAARAAHQHTFTYANRQFPVHLPTGSALPDTPEGWFYVTHEGVTDGLSISEDYNWLGCSPDGLVWIMGQPVGCLEIKCPASKPMQCYPLMPMYYIDQVLGQMLFLNVTFCHFYVWTPTGYTLGPIEWDIDYAYGTIVRYLTEMWFQELLPVAAANKQAMIERVLTRVNREEEKKEGSVSAANAATTHTAAAITNGKKTKAAPKKRSRLNQSLSVAADGLEVPEASPATSASAAVGTKPKRQRKSPAAAVPRARKAAGSLKPTAAEKSGMQLPPSNCLDRFPTLELTASSSAAGGKAAVGLRVYPYTNGREVASMIMLPFGDPVPAVF